MTVLCKKIQPTLTNFCSTHLYVSFFRIRAVPGIICPGPREVCSGRLSLIVRLVSLKLQVVVLSGVTVTPASDLETRTVVLSGTPSVAGLLNF